jgi:hypothetical protein
VSQTSDTSGSPLRGSGQSADSGPEIDLRDEETPRVFYDLGEWDFDQQAELTSALAESEIPHAWDGTELVVPAEFEEAADAVFADVEQRLEAIGKGVPDYGVEADGADEGDDDFEREDVEAVAREIADDTTLTEYDLADWDELERSLVGDTLAASNIPFRWEELVLLVPTEDESAVDTILDEVESGDVIPVINDGEDGDELPFESLNSFFLAGERLRKDPRDADGLERLLDALKIADPNRPPRGVELRVWRRSCELAEQLADTLVEGSDGELEDAMPVAEDLHDLLRPLI